MYVDGYMDRKRTGEVLHVAERINGQRILRELEPVYEYYVESPNGTYKTVNGTLAERFEFTRHSEMKKSLDSTHVGRTIYESDCNVTFKTLAKHYMGKPSPELNIAYFDIETDFHKKFGYAPPSDPFNRVTAISLYQSWTGKDFVFTLPPADMDLVEAQDIVNRLNAEDSPDTDSIVVLYTDEREMFRDFFDLIENADVLTGWNSEFFDIPYMVNRTRKLFNEAHLAYWCLWNKKPAAREADMFGKTIVTYDLIGRVHLDYLALYKKHAGQVEQSYKLDYIAEKVTGENKVPYDGSLDKLYREDYERFLRYSKQDSILLKKIDEKMDFINLHNRLAHKECVLISTTMGSVALIDTAIINLAHSRGEVVFNKKKQEEEEDYGNYFDDEDFDEESDEAAGGSKAAGAWVQDPVLGLVDWLGCTDFSSLYPTVLRSLGMSTECILGQIRQEYTDAVLGERIEQQRIKSKSKTFTPKWTEAWHGLFASVEFTMVHEKSDQVLTVDLEDGTSFKTTGAELYDIIFAPDSTIVMSANGTLFDKNRHGVIPEILTQWYSERKAQQKMVIDYKHLAKDGWELPADVIAEIEAAIMASTAGTALKRTNLHGDDPIYLMAVAEKAKNWAEVGKIIAENGMNLREGRVFCSSSEKKHCMDMSAFWKQNQQIRKILLNSLYGALLNKGSRFFDKRLGQSVTLTGRSMTKHMASSINEICTGTYSESGGVVVYGDTDSVYFSVAHYAKEQGEEFNLTKEEVIDLYVAIGDEVGEGFAGFMDKSFNTGMEKGKLVGADLEMVGSRGLFLKKKRYAILKFWEDGFRLDEDGPGKIKAMGLEIKRSDTPKYIQDFLEDTLIALLVGEDEQELRTRVREFKREFKDKPAQDKGSPKTVKNYSNKYDEFVKTGECRVGHVMAAIQWNRLREINDDMSVPEATDGTKVIVCVLKPNPYGIKNIGFPVDCIDYLPEWFLSLPFDEDAMEQAVLTKKLDNIFGILDMDIGIDEKSNIELNTGFFSW